MGMTKNKATPEQNPVEVPLYTHWDAARYLSLPIGAVIAISGYGSPGPEWFFHSAWRGWPNFRPDGEGPPFAPEEFPRFSFRQLADFFVRSVAVQAAWEQGRKAKNNGWCQIQEAVWWSLDPHSDVSKLFSITMTEEAIDQIIERYVRHIPNIQSEWLRKRIIWGIERVEVLNNIPVRLYPFSRDPAEGSPRLIVLDPCIRFGRPTVRGVPTDILLERFRAGDSTNELAADYDLPASEVDEAIRYETMPSAPLVPPFWAW